MVSRTGIGAGIGIPFKNNALKGDKPYLPPEIKDSLKAVVIAYGKTNNDSDRAIVKNLVDPDNPFVISNAAFKLNSGFGEYAADFLDWTSSKDAQKTSFEVKITSSNYKENWVAYKAPNTTFKAMKVRISGIPDGGYLQFFRTTADGGGIKMVNGINKIPAFTNTVVAGFYIDIPLGFDWSNLVIEQIPSFEGAFVTDGVNDLITSTKTVQEMLGGSNEITVVSMIHGIGSKNAYTNVLRESGSNYIKNTSTADGKTGIYGYTCKDTTKSIITDILGDKNDYKLEYIQTSTPSTINSVFGVAGWRDSSVSVVVYPVAWYWTIIANKVLTTDQINQVIAYFNLDRTLKPDILCNTIKQGITNENHAEFGDKLIDYSGNGRDIQLNNIAWDGDSGIGKYNYPNWKVNVTRGNKYARIVYYDSINGTYSADFKGITDLYKSYGLSVEIRVNRANTIDYHSIKEDGIYTVTPPDDTTSIDIRFGGENVYNASCDITITQIPSHAGGLCLDGINDFGKVTGMPVYKDYTVVADYERLKINIGVDSDSPILSKSESVNLGAFIFNTISSNGDKVSYSFGRRNIINADDTIRKIFYQSKYINDGQDINIESTFVDSDKLWLGTYRDSDYRFIAAAIYSLMSFPYSMSEFLIERQLKKHKLGTLYPNMVEFRPVIKSNASYDNIVFYYKNEKVENGTYLTVGSSIGMHIRLSSNSVNEIKSITINGIPATFNFHDANNNIYQYDFNLTSKSPQKINITIDEYIRYEDIVQPYPALLRFKDENGNEVSWGGKFRVGSTITRIGSAADSNLLPNIYNIFGLLLNDNQVTSSKVIVEKTMVFKAKSAYIFDNNEPNCILSPRLLRIPNSSYKILGHIPDISGHGNHGKINNSAYKLNSGVNGYLVDFTTLKDDGIKGIVRTDSKIYLDKSFNYNQGFWLGRTNNPSPAYKVKVSGIPETGMLTYTGGVWLNLVNGINELPARTNTEEEHGFVIQSPNLDWSNLVIEQIGEYEGAYCLDGVDDFVTIPTLSSGGKQVLMKVNWHGVDDEVLYDQRNSNIQGNYDLAISTYPDTIAYNFRNEGGKTFIDGILNSHIITNNLKNITHNISSINGYNNDNNSTICIGKSVFNGAFAQMALYDFMLFDNISTDDKIKELNEYVGIEAKVELPPYYWDAYGKTNSDADRDTIQQRGVAVGNYDLTNYNHAYDKMSGYGGYKFAKFDNTIEWFAEDSSMVVNRNGYLITLKKVPNVAFWRFRNTTLKSLDNPLTFKVKCNKPIDVIFQVKFAKNNDVSIGYNYNIKEVTLVPNESTTIIVPSVSVSDIPEATSILFINVLFDNTSLSDNEEYTVEMLPLYPNGLLYDAVTDYSENVNIPVFTDFTAIMKRKWLKNQGCPLIKGSKVYEGGNGNALLFEWDKAYNFVFYKRTDIMEGEVPENISFITPTNYNGNVITRGSEQDTNGICIAGDGNAGFANMVFYKLILYPKTIPLLQINFLKNLMERDEIIDLNNPIFIQE